MNFFQFFNNEIITKINDEINIEINTEIKE